MLDHVNKSERALGLLQEMILVARLPHVQPDREGAARARVHVVSLVAVDTIVTSGD